MHNPRPLTNNTVLITGAASGIGRSLCHRLGEKGASLALIDRDEGALRDLERELEMAGFHFGIAIADVRDRQGLGQAVDALVRELGPIDILVASAGVCGISFVDDLKVEQVEEILKVNFLGVVYTIDCLLPSMLLRKSGHIVGIASLAAICGLPLEEAYNASKAALAIYLEGLRPVLRRRGIAVTTVFPGFVNTHLLDALMVSMGIRRLFGSIEPATATARITQAILQRRRVYSFPRTTTLLAHGARLLPAAALDWIKDRMADQIPVANARKPLGAGADRGVRVQ
jgi:short-subunit dehydrogenase